MRMSHVSVVHVLDATSAIHTLNISLHPGNNGDLRLIHNFPEKQTKFADNLGHRYNVPKGTYGSLDVPQWHISISSGNILLLNNHPQPVFSPSFKSSVFR